MELSEHPFSKRLLDSFEFYLQESGEDAVFPVSVSEESVQVGMIVKCFPSSLSLCGKDSGELTLFDTEHLRERSPSGTKENGVVLAVVTKQHP